MMNPQNYPSSEPAIVPFVLEYPQSEGELELEKIHKEMRESCQKLSRVIHQEIERRAAESIKRGFEERGFINVRPRTEHERRASRCPSCGACEGEKIALINKSRRVRDLEKQLRDLQIQFNRLKAGLRSAIKFLGKSA